MPYTLEIDLNPNDDHDVDDKIELYATTHNDAVIEAERILKLKYKPQGTDRNPNKDNEIIGFITTDDYESIASITLFFEESIPLYTTIVKNF